MADDDAIQRKRERLEAETYEYFWNVGANSTMEASNAHAAALCLARPGR